MAQNDAEKVAEAIGVHGDQLGGNLVHFKRFLDGQRKQQEEFLQKQAEENADIQRKALSATRWAAVAAGLAAVAAIVQLAQSPTVFREPSPAIGASDSEQIPSDLPE